MDSRTSAAQEPKAPFIAVNFLPVRSSFKGNALQLLDQQIETAKSHGFTHGWLNPTCELPKTSICDRIDLDTGLPTTLYQSLYAPESPLEMRTHYPKTPFKALIQRHRSAGFHLLIDFVWKHVSINSSLVSDHKSWFGKTLNDIIEFKFEFDATTHEPTTHTQNILKHLTSVIDLYLDPDSGYGFSGLRIDAASHMSPQVRLVLLNHIKRKYPHAVILEECLFDRTQELNIRSLMSSAHEHRLYTDYITSNLYYQKLNAFGELPKPSEMGDAEKIQLAEKRAISFTGNHDHFSAGWSVALSMAAKLICANDAYLNVIKKQSATPYKNDAINSDRLVEHIELIARGATFAECLEAEHQKCFRFLLPVANGVARTLLNPHANNHEKLLSEFKTLLFQRLAQRTIPSMHGYFVLFDELISPFAAHRIFANRDGGPLPQIFLTVDDLLAKQANTKKIIDLISQDLKSYPNIKNFHRVAPVDELAQDAKSKKAKKPGQIDLTYALHLWLPIITDYLRHHPDFLKDLFPEALMDIDSQPLKTLTKQIGIPEFITALNQLYRQLSTPRCDNYHTFTTSDNALIVIRQSTDKTDIIIINLNPSRLLDINDIDIEKIALWHQSRLFSQQQACGTVRVLASPFNGKESIEYAANGYAEYWRSKVGHEFDKAYLAIVGNEAGHQTHLHLGLSIRNNIESNKMIKIVSHVKSKRQADEEAFNQHAIELTKAHLAAMQKIELKFSS